MMNIHQSFQGNLRGNGLLDNLVSAGRFHIIIIIAIIIIQTLALFPLTEYINIYIDFRRHPTAKPRSVIIEELHTKHHYPGNSMKQVCARDDAQNIIYIASLALTHILTSPHRTMHPSITRT